MGKIKLNKLHLLITAITIVISFSVIAFGPKKTIEYGFTVNEEQVNLLDYWSSKLEKGFGYTSDLVTDRTLSVQDTAADIYYIVDLDTLQIKKLKQNSGYGRSYDYGGIRYLFSSGWLYKTDLKTGKELKEKVFEFDVWDSVFYDNYAVVSLRNGVDIRCIDLRTHEVIWSQDDGKPGNTAVKVYIDDSLLYYVDGSIKVVNIKDGTIRNEYKGSYSEPLAFDDENVYATGKILSKIRKKDGHVSRDPLGFTNFIGQDDGYLYLSNFRGMEFQKVDKNTLDIIWSVPMNNSYVNDAMIFDSVVVLDTNLNQIVILGQKDGKVHFAETYPSVTSIYQYDETLFILKQSGEISAYRMDELDLIDE